MDPAEIVMIKSDPGNTSGIFLYILDVFEEKNLFFEHRGLRMRVGGVTSFHGHFPWGLSIFLEKKFFSEFGKFWAIQLVNIAFFEVKMSKYWQN